MNARNAGTHMHMVVATDVHRAGATDHILFYIRRNTMDPLWHVYFTQVQPTAHIGTFRPVRVLCRTRAMLELLIRNATQTDGVMMDGDQLVVLYGQGNTEPSVLNTTGWRCNDVDPSKHNHAAREEFDQRIFVHVVAHGFDDINVQLCRLAEMLVGMA